MTDLRIVDINFENWNPQIDHTRLKVDVALQLTEFPLISYPRLPFINIRRISINCFGFGGTNCHVVLDDAESFLKQQALPISRSKCSSLSTTPGSTTPVSSYLGSWRPSSRSSILTADMFDTLHLIVFSMQDRHGLNRLASSHIAHIGQNAASPPFCLQDYAYTMYSRRSLLKHRAFVVARSIPDLMQKMANLDDPSDMEPLAELTPALVFSGQGAQWACMGMELMAFATYQESIHTADAYMQKLDNSFHLSAALRDRWSDMHLPEVAQATTTAVQVALVDLLEACGIQAASVVGHSSGEIAAAYAARLITREDAWKLAFYRGKSVAASRELCPEVKGAMLAVGLSKVDVQTYIYSAGVGLVTVACNNSPRLVTLSGDRDAILTIKTKLDRDGIFNSPVKTETAYHSPHMELIAQQYLESIGKITPNGEGKALMYSSVFGRQILPGELTAEYWIKNLTQPVEFEDAVRRMIEPVVGGGVRPNAFIEVGPHNVWRQSLEQIVEKLGSGNTPLPYFSTLCRGRDAAETLLEMVGQLFLHGCKVNMDWYFHRNEYSSGPRSLIDLPPYSWDHSKKYWQESHMSRDHRLRQFGRRDLIGSPTFDAILPFEPRWRGFFRVHETPWILDHRIQNEILYPAAGMVCMAFEGADQMVHSVVDKPSDILDFEVSNLEIKAPMVVPTTDRGLEHFMSARRTTDACHDGVTTWRYDFTIFSKLYDDAPFQENAKGVFGIRFYKRGVGEKHGRSLLSKPHDTKHKRVSQGSLSLGESMSRQSSFEFYEGLDVIGMTYGPPFRNIVDIGRLDSAGDALERWAIISIPNTKEQMPEKFEFDHLVHPATLDSIFQTAITAEAGPMIPTYIENIRVAADLTTEAGAIFFSVAKGTDLECDQASADIDVWHCTEGERAPIHVVEVTGLRAQSINSVTGRNFLPSHRHLVSTFIWKEDVKRTNMDVFGARDWLGLVAHKHPDASILHIGDSIDTISTIVNYLSGESSSAPGFGKYIISTKSKRDYHEILKNVAKNSRHLLDYRDPDCLASPGNEIFDLVLYDSKNRQSKKNLHRFASAVSTWFDQAEPNVHRLLGQDILLNPTELHSVLDDGRFVLLTPQETQCISLAEELRQCLQCRGFPTTVEALSWVEFQPHDINEIVISLVDMIDTDDFVFSMDEQQYGLVKMLLTKSTRLLWVTRGAQMNCESPKSSLFLGWARSVRSEDDHKRIVCLDLDVQDRQPKEIAELLGAFALSSMSSASLERDTEYAERDGKFYVPRLVPLDELNSVIEKAPAEEENPIAHHMTVDGSGIYVVFGGFGGLGMAIAEWLVEQGAGRIALVSRSGVPKDQELHRRFQELCRSKAAQVHSYSLDMCNIEEVSSLVRELQDDKKLKIRGVIHAAGVLRDAAYQNIDHRDWAAAVNPKTTGSWNIHRALPKDIDFLVLLSSASGIIGNRGQANYAAGNAFQDALARHRTASGLHTVSLDLGPVIGVGMADPETLGRLKASGFFGIRLRDVLFLLERTIAGYGVRDERIPAQVVVGVGTGGLIQQNGVADPFWAGTALFSILNRVDLAETAAAGSPLASSPAEGDSFHILKQALKKANTEEEAAEKLMKGFTEAIVEMLPNLRAHNVREDMTPAELGSDSMRGASLDGWLKRATGFGVGMGINGMPVRRICEEVVRKAGFGRR